MNQLDKPKEKIMTKASEEFYNLVRSIVPNPGLLTDFKLSINNDNFVVITCEYYCTDENLRLVDDLSKVLKKEYTFVEKDIT